jgi:hypothetical protein
VEGKTMRDPFPWPEEGTPEQLVRQHLDAQARADGTEPADAVLRRVYQRLDADAPRPLTLPQRRPHWRSSLAAGLVAAGLVIGLLVVAQPAAMAGPSQLVVEALQASLPEADREYLLQVQAIGADDQPMGNPLRESHLWTRGDRYRIDSVGQDFRMGQDEQHRIWIAPTRDEGIRFAAQEAPEKLALISDLRTLNLDVLLRELTRGFRLTWDEDTLPASFPNTRRILGKPRGDRLHGVQSVLLEVEPESKIVRRVVVERVRQLTQTRVRLTLQWIASHAQPDSFYHLESVLKPGAPIHEGAPSRDQLLRLFMRRVGPPAQ